MCMGFWIGKCENYSLGDGHTGSLTQSRIVIEEVFKLNIIIQEKSE